MFRKKKKNQTHSENYEIPFIASIPILQKTHVNLTD